MSDDWRTCEGSLIYTKVLHTHKSCCLQRDLHSANYFICGLKHFLIFHSLQNLWCVCIFKNIYNLGKKIRHNNWNDFNMCCLEEILTEVGLGPGCILMKYHFALKYSKLWTFVFRFVENWGIVKKNHQNWKSSGKHF